MPKLQSRALRKILFKKKQDSISQVDMLKNLEIFQFSVSTKLSFYVPDWEQRLVNSFFDCGDNHSYLTKSKAKCLVDIPFVNIQISSTQSIVLRIQTTSETIFHICFSKNVPIH